MIPVYRLDDSIEYVTDETKTSRSRHAESLRGAIADALNEGRKADGDVTGWVRSGWDRSGQNSN